MKTMRCLHQSLYIRVITQFEPFYRLQEKNRLHEGKPSLKTIHNPNYENHTETKDSLLD